MRYAYLHGFASSSRSYKGTQLSERLAGHHIDLETPDLNRPSFQRLTATAMLEELDRLDSESSERWCFIGSSLGGWLAARWAQLNPKRVDRLVLLCPGFDLASRWPSMLGEPAWSNWEKNGWIQIAGADEQMTKLHWEFIEDLRSHPAVPPAGRPTVIVHGSRDEIVPIRTSRSYAVSQPEVERLVEVDDDHGLASSIDIIEQVVVEHFDLG